MPAERNRSMAASMSVTPICQVWKLGGVKPAAVPPIRAQNPTQAGSSSDAGTTGTGHLDDHGLW